MDGKGIINTKNEYRIAFYEVDEILKNMPEELYNKIPKSFRSFIKENKIEKYDFQFAKTDKLNEVQLTRKTKILLSLIYRNYLLSKEQREILYDEDNRLLKEAQTKLNEKYSYENLFKKEPAEPVIEEKNEEVSKQETAVVKYEKKNNILMKLIKKIKSCFKKSGEGK